MTRRPKATVLCVDDERQIVDALRRALSDEFRMITALSAAAALDIMKTEPVDVLVTDEDMPHMKGTELLGVVAERHPHIVRMVLTGRASLQSTLSAINKGQVFRYLLKPCKVDDLRAAIRDALVQGSALREDPALERLSAREREVLSLVVRGMRVKHIADRHAVTEHTVRNQLKAMYRKLGVHSQAELVSRFRAPLRGS